MLGKHWRLPLPHEKGCWWLANVASMSNSSL
jgi:hypothetical protein